VEEIQDEEGFNAQGMAVLRRIAAKLNGTDFTPPESLIPLLRGKGSTERLTVKLQVKRLIAQATSLENLCQAYIGWCPFW